MTIHGYVLKVLNKSGYYIGEYMGNISATHEFTDDDIKLIKSMVSDAFSYGVVGKYEGDVFAEMLIAYLGTKF
jgi:hypothetical protein